MVDVSYDARPVHAIKTREKIRWAYLSSLNVWLFLMIVIAFFNDCQYNSGWNQLLKHVP